MYSHLYVNQREYHPTHARRVLLCQPLVPAHHCAEVRLRVCLAQPGPNGVPIVTHIYLLAHICMRISLTQTNWEQTFYIMSSPSLCLHHRLFVLICLDISMLIIMRCFITIFIYAPTYYLLYAGTRSCMHLYTCSCLYVSIH